MNKKSNVLTRDYHFYFIRFSSKVLTVFCQQTENRPLAGVIVIGEGQSARAVALAGTAMKLPVLWAKGGTASLNGKHKEVSTQTTSVFAQGGVLIGDTN